MHCVNVGISTRNVVIIIYLGQINVAAILYEDRRVFFRSSEVELTKHTYLSAPKYLPRTF